jgi:peptide/nickel transport system permease protein
MVSYFVRRIIYMVFTLWLISIVVFVIIQLPPGDMLSAYIRSLEAQGDEASVAHIESLRSEYGLDLPLAQRYLRWFLKMLRGNLGRSFGWNRTVNSLLAERLPLTVTLSLLTLTFTYLVAIPIGIYSATHQYSIADYIFTVLGFMGLSIPGFLFALILMFFFYRYFGFSAGGLFSQQFQTAPWSWAKFVDLLKHLPVPIIVTGLAGTASLIRVMRNCLLDELRKQYVVTARVKGVKEAQLLYKYPVRVAINPLVSYIGWILPTIVSGGTVIAIVLNLPTVGPLLYGALISQDMYLAGSIVMVLSLLVVIGTFVSDILLVVVDPRIRFERSAK